MKHKLILLALLLCACGPRPPVQSNPVPVNTETSGRIVVVDASVFRDAKGNSRDILVLRDTETGKEYLAVLGAGVTQIVEECTYNPGTKTTTCTEEEEP